MALNGEESWLCLMCCNSDSESKDLYLLDPIFAILMYGLRFSTLLRNCNALAHFIERTLGIQEARLRKRLRQAITIRPRIEISNGRHGSGSTAFDGSNSYKTRATSW